MADLIPAFASLSAILRKHAADLSIKTDDATNFYVEEPAAKPGGKPRFFGAVQIKKSYVSFHLMPVYDDPALLDGISESLRKKMQGKSCFNFTAVDAKLFKELDALTRRCARKVAAASSGR